MTKKTGRTSKTKAKHWTKACENMTETVSKEKTGVVCWVSADSGGRKTRIPAGRATQTGKTTPTGKATAERMA